MGYRDIVVHIDDSNQNEARIKAGIAIASKFDAHLTGLYRIPELDPRVYMDVGLPLERLDQQQSELQSRAVEHERQFMDAVSGLSSSVEWRTCEGHFASLTRTGALYADIFITGQHDANDPQSPALDSLEGVVMQSGRPVLMVPYIGLRESVAENVLVAWNESREAARAVHDALPLLQKAKQVHILTMTDSTEEVKYADAASSTLAHHLSRHGVSAEAHHHVETSLSPGETMLSRSTDLGADLVVMGAYGHSRLRELVLGGATRTWLNEMTVPVLMSH